MNLLNAKEAREKLSSGQYFITPFLIGDGHYTDRKISYCVISPIGKVDYYVLPFKYPKLSTNREQSVFSGLAGGIIFSNAARYFYNYGITVYDSLVYRWFHLDRTVETDSSGVYEPDGQSMPLAVGIDIHFQEKSKFESVYLRYGLSDSYLTHFNAIYQEILSIEYNGIFYRKSLGIGEGKGEILKGYHSFTTRTGRISYKTGNGINLLSIPKNDERRKIVSRYGKNGTLVEFDFDGFHIRILANMLGLDEIANYSRVHEYFAKQYFGVAEVTPEQYELSKKLTFHELYSDSKNEYGIEFFNLVNSFRNKLWEDYQIKKNIQSKLGRFIIDPTDAINNPGKLLSYLIQANEVEIACTILQKINDAIVSMPLHIVLYTYDSFLMDVNNITAEYLARIFSIFKQYSYPAKVKMGYNYFEMVDVTNKIEEYVNKD